MEVPTRENYTVDLVFRGARLLTVVLSVLFFIVYSEDLLKSGLIAIAGILAFRFETTILERYGVDHSSFGD